MALRLLSGLPSERTPGRNRRNLRRGPRLFRSRVEGFLAKRTEADFQAWPDQQDWTARKYAMWQAGEKLPSQKPSRLMKCVCGQQFDSHRMEEAPAGKDAGSQANHGSPVVLKKPTGTQRPPELAASFVRVMALMRCERPFPGPQKPAGESGFCGLSDEGSAAQTNRAARH